MSTLAPPTFFLVVLSYWSSPTMNCRQVRSKQQTRYMYLLPVQRVQVRRLNLQNQSPPPLPTTSRHGRHPKSSVAAAASPVPRESLPRSASLLAGSPGSETAMSHHAEQTSKNLFGRLVDLQDVSQRHLVSQLQGLAASEDTCQHLSTLVDTCRAVPHRRHDVLGSLQQSVVVD